MIRKLCPCGIQSDFLYFRKGKDSQRGNGACREHWVFQGAKRKCWAFGGVYQIWEYPVLMDLSPEAEERKALMMSWPQPKLKGREDQFWRLLKKVESHVSFLLPLWASALLQWPLQCSEESAALVALSGAGRVRCPLSPCCGCNYKARERNVFSPNAHMALWISKQSCCGNE